ncbi:MAG: hypothetical protein ACKVI4_14580 [Actinomycetales bacterium]|tara:strand:- start:370 stop:1122 length:753 start_codon:yes stop_codon:yes gene_type:complete
MIYFELAMLQRTVVIFDCESDGGPAGGDFSKVQCTCACAIVCSSEDVLKACGDPSLVDTMLSPSVDVSKRITCWRDVCDEGYNPFHNLFLAFDSAEAIVAHNGLDFDFPLLRKHYGKSNEAQQRYMAHRFKTLDCFNVIRSLTGGWIALNTILRNNKLSSKTGDGRDAIKWWCDGQRSKLRAYCFKDVELTARVCLLPKMVLPGVGNVPTHLYSIASFLASLRFSPTAEAETDWLVVSSPAQSTGSGSSE